MGKTVQRRRGTTAQHAAFIGALGELTVDTTKKTVVVHDGSTIGGFPVVSAPTLAAQGGAATVGFTPTGTIAATTVQAAIVEVATEAASSSTSGITTAIDALKTDLATTAGSFMIGHVALGTGATARTVQSKLREKITIQDFGGVGDGVADDTTAFTNAITAAAGAFVDGLGKTYKITAPITFSTGGITLENMTLNLAAVPDQSVGNPDQIITFAGTQGSVNTLTADMAANSATVAIASTAGFSVDQYAYLYSTNAVSSGLTLGQIVKVKAITSGTQLTLYNPVLYPFLLANNAAIAPLTLVDNVTLRNVKFVGAGSKLQSALTFNMCSDVVVDGCEFFNFDYNACTFTRSVNTKLTNSTIRKSNGAGAAAVFVNNGTVGANITQCYISSATNGVVIGGTNGVSTYTNISDNVVYGVSQSPITATPLSDFTSINNNMVESSNLFVSFQDGISVNGFNASVTNNTIVGSHRYAISAQAKASFGSCSYVISNNQMRNIVSTASSDVGIYVANDSAGGSIIDSLIMSDNNIDGSPDIHMQVFSTGGNIKNVSITGNVTNDNATDTGILLKTAGAYTITDAIVRGNIVKAADTVPAIRLFGLTTSLISRVLICDNSVMGGLSGVQLDYTADVTMRNNTIMLNIPTGSGMFTQATTVVTVTTATAHGLVVGDYIDLTAPTVTTGGIIAGYRFVVLTVPTATTFTLGAGSATVATATAISWTKPRSKYAIDSNTVRCSLDRTDSMPVHILGTTTSAYPYKVFAEDDWVYSSCAVAVNILLPVATQFPGREIKFKTYSALAMNSLTSNIAEYNSQTANTNAIVPATAAWWAVIKSNGSVWQKINRGMQ